jgi:nucleoside-diphosphate-sugar epimerase
VYGPRDMLFLHNILGAGNKVRIFGTGTNKCSFCHVDNYCHGLILGERALVPGGRALGRFYIVTDGPPQDFWRVLDVALVAVGCRSVFAKTRLPKWFILPIAYLATLLGMLLRRKFKLNPFAARMLMIHRWFDIQASTRDLGYEPVIAFEQGWADTVEWFRTVWAPQHGPNRHKAAAAAKAQ